MSEETPNRPFSEKVTQQLSPDARELWAPLADTFEREGPESVKTYLDSEMERLGDRVTNLLEEFQVK